jgi:ribosomal protein S18 acetylase RimI-like enzyme
MVRLKAVSGEEMVGFIAVDLRTREHAAWIATVCVLPEQRRKGIGRALMEAVEQQIPFDTIRLCVRATNTAAQLLYRQLGYHTYEIWRQYYRDREDALVMEKIRGEGETGYNKLR